MYLKMYLQLVATVLCLFGYAAITNAEIQTKKIDYKHGDVELQGVMCWDDAKEGKRPGVLVVHEWWGLNDYAQKRAKQLAELGYVAFALDMYGKGQVTEHPKQAGEWAGEVRKNVEQWRERALLGLDILKKDPHVDSSKLAAIGYCFGGSTVLQIAYSGADIDGVVSFHGALVTADEDQAKQTKASILICHGADDAFITKESIDNFKTALTKAEKDWQMIYYANARHSFTNPGADEKGIPMLKYNKKADQRSWQHMQDFFEEIFAE